MVKLIRLETRTPPALAIGDIRVCKDATKVLEILGYDAYWEFHQEASLALFPECPELAFMFPVLSFNTSERPRLSFYEDLAFDGPLSEAPDIRAWHRKLPDDGGELFRKAQTIMKWAY